MISETTWSVRNIAEYAYCPRLFYLMEVEGLHIDSADTEEGNAVHRRVDIPSPIRDNDIEAPIVARSLNLTSESLNISGTLDIAEINGNIATPVEYRKGRPYLPVSEDSENNEYHQLREPWPTDRVQLGLQALLLQEAGYQVQQGVLYYAAERLRLNLTITDEMLQEARTTLAAAIACSIGSRPLPLVNDARCPRCSLQPICLPDEINYEYAEETTVAPRPRQLWPPRDDGFLCVAQQQNTSIGVRGNMLRMTDRSGKMLREIPLVNIEALVVLGYVQVSTQALHTLAYQHIPVAFCSSAGRLVTITDPMESVSAQTRCAQVYGCDNEESQLTLARALITAKIRNQRTLLMRNYPNLTAEIAEMLLDQVHAAEKATNLSSLRGHEGQAASLYFQRFHGMLQGEWAQVFQQHGRQRRPPPDPVNACLSLAYTMLAHEATTALRLASLEPSIGAFHVYRPGRPALSLDLMEPFRPLIADSVAISLFNRREVDQSSFRQTTAGCQLTDSGRKAFFFAYGRRMNDEVTHPVFGYHLSYRRMMMLHARMIAAWLRAEIPTLAFLTTR